MIIPNAGKDLGKLAHFTQCQSECKLVHPLWKTVSKLNMKLSYEPGVACLGVHSRKEKICAHVKTYIQMFLAALLVIAKS